MMIIYKETPKAATDNKRPIRSIFKTYLHFYARGPSKEKNKCTLRPFTMSQASHCEMSLTYA